MQNDGNALIERGTDRDSSANESGFADHLLTTKFPRLSLWVDRRRSEMRVTFDNGPVLISHPLVLREEEIVDLEEAFTLLIRGLKRTAKRISSREGELA